jgi:hypothetical protein
VAPARLSNVLATPSSAMIGEANEV